MSFRYIFFYDFETVGQGDDLCEPVEFGGIAVCKDGLYELPEFSFHTIIQPKILQNRGKDFRGWDGTAPCIPWRVLEKAPTFGDIADKLFELMDGKLLRSVA